MSTDARKLIAVVPYIMMAFLGGLAWWSEAKQSDAAKAQVVELRAQVRASAELDRSCDALRDAVLRGQADVADALAGWVIAYAAPDGARAVADSDLSTTRNRLVEAKGLLEQAATQCAG